MSSFVAVLFNKFRIMELITSEHGFKNWWDRMVLSIPDSSNV